MDPTLAVPQNGCNPFPQKANSLDSIHQLLPNMTADQMERGRKLGALRSKQGRLLRQARKVLTELKRVTEALNSLYCQSTGSTAPVLPVPQDVLELRVLDNSLDISLSRRREGEEKPSLTGSLQRVRAKKPGYRQDTDYSPGFLRFWSVWPKKVGKISAYAEWTRLSPDQVLEDRIIAAVQAQIENTWHDQDAKYILDPERWLKRGRWEDEIIKPKLTREQEIDQEYQRLCKETADG